MDADDLIMVSVDDHVIEPPHLLEGRVPKKYQEMAPRFIRRDGGTVWVYENVVVTNTALNARWHPGGDVSIRSTRHLRPALQP